MTQRVKSMPWRLASVVICIGLVILAIQAIRSETLEQSKTVEEMVAAVVPATEATATCVLQQVNGEHLVVTGDNTNQTLQIIEADTHDIVQTVPMPSGASAIKDLHADFVDQVAYVVCQNGDIHELDAVAGTISTLFSSNGSIIRTSSLDTTGVIAAIDRINTTLYLFDTKTSTTLTRAIPSRATDVALKRDGTRVAVVTNNGSNSKIKLYDPTNPGPLLGDIAITDGASEIAFSNGRLYVSVDPKDGFSRVLIADFEAMSITGQIEVPWGDLSLDTGFDSLVVFSGRGDSVSLYSTFADPDSPELVGVKTCVTGQTYSYGDPVQTEPPFGEYPPKRGGPGP